jgi:hypothetical protein
LVKQHEEEPVCLPVPVSRRPARGGFVGCHVTASPNRKGAALFLPKVAPCRSGNRESTGYWLVYRSPDAVPPRPFHPHAPISIPNRAFSD